jgi:hypothetical protein
MAMSDLPQGRAPKRDKVRMVGDDVVTANSLATHLGMTRQNVARLTAEAVIEQRSDGYYDQTASRLRYIKHLRAEHRRSPRSEADAEYTAAKAALLRIRIAEQKSLIPLEAISTTDEVIGLMLTHMSDMAARCGGHDLQLRRRIEQVVYETRVAMSEAASKLADQRGEPVLDEA